MKLSELKVNPRNPQSFDDLSALKNSLKDFPKMLKLRPLIYDPETMFVLGGNKRLICLQELGFKEIPDEWTKSAADLTEEEKKRFVVADNAQFGEWDWDILSEDYEKDDLEEWGLDFGGVDVDESDMSDSFSLPDGDKESFQIISFTLSNEQAEFIKENIKDAKQTDQYKNMNTFDNENSNGNALYLIISQWKETSS